MHKAAQAYLQTQVTTTTQADILLMLYDGAIKFLNRAKEYLAENDMAGKGIYISRALDIINELDSTLNMEKGGELAQNLHGLYGFCTKHLLTANLRKNAVMLDEVIAILAGLRSAYAQIMDQPEARAAAATAAAGQNPAKHQSRAQPALPGLHARGNAPAMTPVAKNALSRGRSAYARQVLEQEADRTAPAVEEPGGLSCASAEEHPAPATAPSGPAAAVDSPLLPETPAAPGGFSPARTGSALYRKFAAG